MPARFAVLHHTGWPGRADHYDLLLQAPDAAGVNAAASDDDRVLLAFATEEDRFPLPEPLLSAEGGRLANPLPGGERADMNGSACRVSVKPAGAVLLVRQADHRRLYLRFEGAVPGGRGRATRVDEGVLTWLAPPGPPMPRELLFRLEGQRLRGGFRLRQPDEGPPGPPSRYLFERFAEP